ncbi:hypothetical protein [Archangium sp.]
MGLTTPGLAVLGGVIRGDHQGEYLFELRLPRFPSETRPTKPVDDAYA